MQFHKGKRCDPLLQIALSVERPSQSYKLWLPPPSIIMHLDFGFHVSTQSNIKQRKNEEHSPTVKLEKKMFWKPCAAFEVAGSRNRASIKSSNYLHTNGCNSPPFVKNFASRTISGDGSINDSIQLVLKQAKAVNPINDGFSSLLAHIDRACCSRNKLLLIYSALS